MENELPKEPDTGYIEALELHRQRCKEASDYALKRFDILIITLSSGALAFSMGFIKDVVGISNNVNFILIKLAWISFGAAVILNLISQITSYYANILESNIIASLIKKEKGKKPLAKECQWELGKSIFDACTIYLNGISFLCFATGTILLITFMLYKF